MDNAQAAGVAVAAKIYSDVQALYKGLYVKTWQDNMRDRIQTAAWVCATFRRHSKQMWLHYAQLIALSDACDNDLGRENRTIMWYKLADLVVDVREEVKTLDAARSWARYLEPSRSSLHSEDEDGNASRPSTPAIKPARALADLMLLGLVTPIEWKETKFSRTPLRVYDADKLWSFVTDVRSRPPMIGAEISQSQLELVRQSINSICSYGGDQQRMSDLRDELHIFGDDCCKLDDYPAANHLWNKILLICKAVEEDTAMHELRGLTASKLARRWSEQAEPAAKTT